MRETEKLKLALSKAHSMVYEWDQETGTIAWSGEAADVSPTLDPESLCTVKSYLSLIHPDDREKFKTSLEQSVSSDGDYNKTYRLCPSDDDVVYIHDMGTIKRSSKKVCLIGMITANGHSATPTNITTDDDEEVPDFDPRSKSNQKFLSELYKAFEENRENEKNSVLLEISIDNLPMMMTWYTVEFADRIMAALEIHLLNILRKDDIIQRIAVDQFGVILKNQSESEAELVVDRILNRIQLYKNPSFEEPIHLRTSIGSVQFPHDANSPEDALNKAYLALSSAKSKSAEFHCKYEDTKKEHLDLKEQMEKLHFMQNAFREDRMRIAFQPVVECKSGKAESYECLLRVLNDDGGYSSAGYLIPVAEKMGVIDIVDQFVMEQVVEELKVSRDVVLSFNVSNLTTDNPKWLKMSQKLLQDHDIASRVIIEITETAAQRDLRQTAYFVASLQALGCQVALDDFGAGYTSFRQIKSLSVDRIKIDGSYIMDLSEHTENLLFIKSLIDFNRSYGLETVAECVETGEVAKMLMELGIDHMQGYYFGKPDTDRPWAA